MEELMIMEDHESSTNPPTINPPSPIWKLYENPFFCPHHPHSVQQLQPKQNVQHCIQTSRPSYHPDVTSSPPMYSDKQSRYFSTHLISSELDHLLAQLQELKAQNEIERRMRRKAELTSKRLAREVSEERRAREAAERVCEELAEEIVSNRAEMGRIKREMEEERNMLRMAEVWREERVQMKLADARVLMEETATEKAKEGISGNKELTAGDFGTGFGEKMNPVNQRRGSPEAENPHIRRGIKGFVEFPRVVRADGSRGRQMGSKMECQRAQLRILLGRQKPVCLSVGRPDAIKLLAG